MRQQLALSELPEQRRALHKAQWAKESHRNTDTAAGSEVLRSCPVPFSRQTNCSREVERLQQKVHDLEHQLEHATKNLVPLENDRSVSSGTNRRGWDGIQTRIAHSAQTQWYGPASSFYFIGRMNAYLSAALQQPQDDHTLQPASPKPKHLAGEGFTAGGHGGAETYLDAIQEDFFLDMFRHSYHPT
ncbi:uncharacterized protein BDW70DRAFT_100177 [Aspergillus foveolatus]|uniref:uncharacterized protein n=1 Tax=Aspergillus foveolatus TaxID=210207 RepID=UPI003CCDB752